MFFSQFMSKSTRKLIDDQLLKTAADASVAFDNSFRHIFEGSLGPAETAYNNADVVSSKFQDCVNFFS